MNSQKKITKPFNETEWVDIVNYFKTKFPTPNIRLVVKRRDCPLNGKEEIFGICKVSKTGKTHTIIVDSSESWNSQLDTLQHEFAHHLWFVKYPNKGDKQHNSYHDDEFWLIRGKIYEQWINYNKNQQ